MLVGITSYTGQKEYKKYKKKNETPWTYYAERMHQNKNKKYSLLKLQPNAKLVKIKQKVVTQELDHLHQQEQEALCSTPPQDATGWSFENLTYSLAISSVSMGLSTAGIWYPPLHILGLPGLLYTSFPVYRKSYQDFKSSELTVSSLIAIIFGALVVQGHFVLGHFIIFPNRRRATYRKNPHL